MARPAYTTERPEIWRRVQARLGVLGMSFNDLLDSLYPELRAGSDPKARSVRRTKVHDTLNGTRPLHPDLKSQIASVLALAPECLDDGADWAAITAPPPKDWQPASKSLTRRRGAPKKPAKEAGAA